VVNVITRDLSGNLASLVKQIDDAVANNESKSMCAFVVLLTDDPDAGVEQLKKFAKEHGIKHTPLTVYRNAAGPPNYKIAKDAQHTVMMWVRSRVEINHAFAAGKLDADALKKVVADTDKILN
jgi:hypothetical protein